MENFTKIIGEIPGRILGNKIPGRITKGNSSWTAEKNPWRNSTRKPEMNSENTWRKLDRNPKPKHLTTNKTQNTQWSKREFFV